MGTFVLGVLVGWLAEWLFFNFWVKDGPKDSGTMMKVVEAKTDEIRKLKQELKDLKASNENTTENTVALKKAVSPTKSAPKVKSTTTKTTKAAPKKKASAKKPAAKKTTAVKTTAKKAPAKKATKAAPKKAAAKKAPVKKAAAPKAASKKSALKKS
jgi:cytoskeletal protein RodZ